MEIENVFSDIFSSFGKRHAASQGKFDREFRQPDRIVGLALRLGLLKEPDRICLVSGSKGKGTTSRLLAWNLQHNGIRVGLILSPEEFSHLDRVRINGQPIPAADFRRLYMELRPHLDELLASAPGDYYISPTGVFLLIGLAWFREQNVQFQVIEGGRGVAHDEVGRVPAAFAILTNVLGEHLDRLGPTLADVARDKLALCSVAAGVWTVPAVTKLADSLGICCATLHAVCSLPTTLFAYPSWYCVLESLAWAVYCEVLPQGVWKRYASPAFQFLRGGFNDGRLLAASICIDGVVQTDCLDKRFLQDSGLGRGAALLGLSDDKAAVALAAELAGFGFTRLAAVRLYSPVGHIRSDWLQEAAIPVLAELDVVRGGTPALRHAVEQLAETCGSVYAIGNQVFIRSLRQAFASSISISREMP